MFLKRAEAIDVYVFRTFAYGCFIKFMPDRIRNRKVEIVLTGTGLKRLFDNYD